MDNIKPEPLPKRYSGLNPAIANEALKGVRRTISTSGQVIGSHIKSYGKSLVLGMSGVEHKDIKDEKIKKESMMVGTLLNPMLAAEDLRQRTSSGQDVSKLEIAGTAFDIANPVPGVAIGSLLPKYLVKASKVPYALHESAEAGTTIKHSILASRKDEVFSEFERQGKEVKILKEHDPGVGEVIDFEVYTPEGHQVAEISSKRAQVIPEAVNINPSGGVKVLNTKLGKMWQNDEMYELVPSTREIDVIYDSSLGLNEASATRNRIHVGPMSSIDMLNSRITHELEHVNQTSFQRVRGANAARTVDEYNAGKPDVVMALDKIMESETFKKYSKRRPDTPELEQAAFIDYWATTGEREARAAADRGFLDTDLLQILDPNKTLRPTDKSKMMEQIVQELVEEGAMPTSSPLKFDNML